MRNLLFEDLELDHYDPIAREFCLDGSTLTAIDDLCSMNGHSYFACHAYCFGMPDELCYPDFMTDYSTYINGLFPGLAAGPCACANFEDDESEGEDEESEGDGPAPCEGKECESEGDCVGRECSGGGLTEVGGGGGGGEGPHARFGDGGAPVFSRE